MKKIIFIAIVTTIIFTHCNKASDNIVVSTPPIPSPKHLIANAGADTTICLPYGGTGNIYKAILSDRASSDDAGKIISCAWSESVDENSPATQAQIADISKDSTSAIFHTGFGLHVFNLVVRDDQGRMANAQVRVNVVSQFNYAYDELSWDSVTGGLSTISVKFKPGILETWPPGLFRSVYFKNVKGCSEISSWKRLPYVPQDSILLTNKPIFYSLVSGHSNIVGRGILYTEIYAHPNSGIDLHQKVSIGFISTTALGF